MEYLVPLGRGLLWHDRPATTPACTCLPGQGLCGHRSEVPETKSVQLTVAGGPASTASELAATSPGPMRSLQLVLPELQSSTHMEQAEAFAVKLVAGFGVKLPVALEFSDWILEASARQRIEPELIASLVFAESSFRKSAQSHVGAVGPAQVRPHYWGAFCGHANLDDPEEILLRHSSAGLFARAAKATSGAVCLQYWFELQTLRCRTALHR